MTEPIVCTLDAEDRPERLATLERLRAAMVELERTTTGLLLRFPRTAVVEDDVRQLAVDEKRCCRFWDFAVVASEGELVLRWDGPATAAPLLDTLESVLRAEEPIEGVDGLL